jgi:hypothetical protein
VDKTAAALNLPAAQRAFTYAFDRILAHRSMAS